VDPLSPEHTEPALDALLRSRRPMAHEGWVEATERRLLPRPARRRAPALRLGAALAAGLATLLLLRALGGSGPLAGGDQSVKAEDGCTTVRVVRTERVPRIEKTGDGRTTVRYESRPVARFERRCR
jgi:hypothetical protein